MQQRLLDRLDTVDQIGVSGTVLVAHGLRGLEEGGLSTSSTTSLFSAAFILAIESATFSSHSFSCSSCASRASFLTNVGLQLSLLNLAFENTRIDDQAGRAVVELGHREVVLRDVGRVHCFRAINHAGLHRAEQFAMPMETPLPPMAFMVSTKDMD